MTLKFRKRHKKFRKMPYRNLLMCLACTEGDHQLCEDTGGIFCACWRDKHEETF